MRTLEDRFNQYKNVVYKLKEVMEEKIYEK